MPPQQVEIWLKDRQSNAANQQQPGKKKAIDLEKVEILERIFNVLAYLNAAQRMEITTQSSPTRITTGFSKEALYAHPCLYWQTKLIIQCKPT